MTQKAASRSLLRGQFRGHYGHYAVTTRSLRLLRGHYAALRSQHGHYAVTTVTTRSLQYFPRAQKTVAFWGVHFGAGEPLSSSFLESHNLDAEPLFLQQHAAGELQSVAS